ncbi:hypothetical protein D3C80_1552270 [compost metagenome]
MVLPCISGVSARRTATAIAAPQEMPHRMPSSCIKRRAMALDSSSVTSSTRSTIDRSRFFGTKPAPIPWILCGLGLISSPANAWEITGDTAGSTATETIGLPWVFLIYRETPVMVPPVPTPATRTSTAPSVSFQISGPVVFS